MGMALWRCGAVAVWHGDMAMALRPYGMALCPMAWPCDAMTWLTDAMALALGPFGQMAWSCGTMAWPVRHYALLGLAMTVYRAVATSIRRRLSI